MDPDEPPPTRASASAALSNISTLSSDVVLLSDSEDSLSNILEEEIMDLNSQLNRKNSVELLNNVFSLVGLSPIREIRNRSFIREQVNIALTFIRQTAEQIYKGEEKDEKYLIDDQLNITMNEAMELVNNFKSLVDSSDYSEKIKLLTLAPVNWEHQARYSIYLRDAGQILSLPIDLRGNIPFDPVIEKEIFNFFHSDEISRNCMCEYHQNPALLLTALNRLMNSRYELTSFIKLMICEQETNDCYSRECSMCNTNLPSSFFIEQLKAKEVNEDDDVTWMIWERNEKRTELQRHTTSITTLLEKLDSLWSKFLIHNFYTIEQREYIKKIKSESSEKGTAVVQLDFAENFTLLSQAAVQSSYWSQKQAPVFTVHIKMGTGHRNLVFISDYMKYTTEFVDQAQRTINDFIKKWYPNVKKM
ncbi:unnamed protein product [Rotaria sordida]|uniref:Uncharacterized protein n=1 Tax=Rotaria sordida TaxID=392033 RepID=A0A819SRT6_9BILA|nr:unnamed protein product [Rotaria sordida]